MDFAWLTADGLLGGYLIRWDENYLSRFGIIRNMMLAKSRTKKTSQAKDVISAFALDP